MLLYIHLFSYFLRYDFLQVITVLMVLLRGVAKREIAEQIQCVIFYSADSSQTVCNKSVSLFSLSVAIGPLGHCRILLAELKILSTGQPLESNVAASQSSKRAVCFHLYITSTLLTLFCMRTQTQQYSNPTEKSLQSALRETGLFFQIPWTSV